ncbi:unnamed protein product [Microthlaspi erraticum]|uniref:DUF4218 domain-containing protein n=1 Tax=Microthlaspi erraticum TaxID=1685480 RepID=A0A6D2J0Y7_9BRAS|nr:unnamed protein product [Microthlaspi erraticum]
MVDKAWVHLCRADPGYEKGASEFVRDVAAALGDVDMIVCPCIDCRNIDRHYSNVVVDHLVTRGMDEAYKRRSDWYHHGELNYGVEGETKSSQRNDEIVGLYKAAGFLDEGFGATADFGMLPADNVLHTSLYEVKKFLKSFDMGYEKIHACVNDCCLFRKKYKKLENCPKCKVSRWKTNIHTGEVKQDVPQKVLRYFPIIPRLKRMFRSEDMARDLRWHFTNKSIDGKLRHPVDSVTWDQMNAKYPSFASEERNVRLGLSTDGFNPFNMKNSMYSCWPVLLVNYNLPPDLCMKKENIMLTLLISGPHQPGNSIDVYLEPLIEDLNHLWNNGEVTYDAFSKSTFTLKAMLLWTISDFPAYGNLAGCKVKGKMGCPLCGKNIDCMWLKFSRKHVYMCHRKRLPPTHSFRGKKSWFDGKVELGRKGRILSGREICQNLRNFKNEFGNLKRSGRKRKKPVCTSVGSEVEDLSSESEEEEEEELQVDVEELLRWKKKSIFFKLPYWEELPVRHNLDVMHIERNVAASIVSTLLHCGKSKDGLQARKDLEELGIRKDLHPTIKGKRTYLPAAPWSLSRTEKKIFCRRLLDFKGPDGYCSDISRGVSLDECKVTGLKSHDYHVLMQQLLPIALRGLLPKGPRLAIVRLCAFFNHLCQRVIDREQLLVMEDEIVETLCMFERFFPPSFFDIMVHLTVHLGREARLGGPVHFRWMYPFERYMKVLKDFFRNPARPEGCIAESYLAEECIQFCSDFLRNTTSVQEKLDRNTEYENVSILEGRPISADSRVTLTEMEKNIAHLVVIQNMAVVEPYVEVTEIILLDYNVFYVALFRCQWAVLGNGVKKEDGFTLVNLHHNQTSFLRDPYILASQAKQVFYSREDESSSWYVVMRGPCRRYSKEEVQEGNADIGPLPSTVVMDVDMDESENSQTDCEGIYV